MERHLYSFFACIIFLISICLNSFAEGSQPVIGKVISSTEKSNSGKLKIEVQYTVQDTIYLKSVPGPKSTLHNGRTILLPDGAPDWKQKQYLPGETFFVVHKFTFDKQNLPLLPIEVELLLEYNLVRISKAPNKDTEEVEIFQCLTFAMIYFRNDKTAEISNPGDFYRLDRVWFTEDSNLIFGDVDPADIPVSDVYPLDTLKEEWQDDYQLHFVERLPYMVATKAVHPDTIAKYNNDDLPLGVEPDSLFEDSNSQGRQAKTLKIKLKRNFKGRITGRLMTTIVNDLGASVTIPLAGVLVKLKEHDKVYNEQWDEEHTDDQGFFTLSYDQAQSFAEGKNIELFIKFKSKNKDYDIKVKEHAVLGASYEHVRWLGHNIGQNYTVDLGVVPINNQNFRPLHWAFRCWTYSQAQGVSMHKSLSIIPHAEASYFVPMRTLVFEPTIRLTTTAARSENTIFHEFGHFVMWHAQNRNFIAIAGVRGFEHSWDEENTTRLAWTEGWADAFAFIMDGAFQNEDGEYSYENGSGYLARIPIMENRRKDWQANTRGIINNGLDSEYFIACAIYDLWDGADKGLPALLPVSAGAPSNLHGFNDFITIGPIASGWVADEDISYSFGQIVQPLLNHAGISGKIQNIYEYYKYFLNEVVGSSCEERERVSRVFNENRVVFDITRFEQQERGYGSMSSDDIGVTVSRRIAGTALGIPILYEDEYFLSNFQDSNVTNNTLDYKFFPFAKRYVSDFDVMGFVTNAGNIVSTTNININTDHGSVLGITNDKNGTLQMCERSGILMNSGALTLGALSNFKASVEIGDQAIILIEREGQLTINTGSSIVVKNGGSLVIRDGANLSILGNGKITVESGGFICIEQGAAINLQDFQSLIELQPGATPGINPVLGFFGNCALPCSITFTGQGAIVNVSQEILAITGPGNLDPEQEEKYSVPASAGFIYNWNIEGDAQIVYGQATNEVTVKAGSGPSFTLVVSASNASTCEVRSGTLVVNVTEPVNALSFDGANDLVRVEDRSALNFGDRNFTFETKFQSNFIGNASVPQILLSKRTFVDGSVADGFILGIFSTGEPFIQLAGSPNHLFTPKVLNGSCHHIAVIRENNALKFFIDGLLSGTAQSSRSISSGGPLLIGRDMPSGFTFNGEIGEVRLWNTVLTDQQIANNIETDYTGNETGLVGLWNMNKNEDQGLTDLSTGALAVLGTSQSADGADPSWTFNSTCGFSMFRVSDHKTDNSGSRSKGFITDAIPMIDSLAESTASELKSFPNPVREEMTLYLKSEQTANMRLEILDSFGNLMFKADGYRTNEAIKIVSPWKAGVYIVRAFFGNEIDETKIIKLE